MVLGGFRSFHVLVTTVRQWKSTLTDPLVSGQLYLRPPSQNLVLLNPHFGIQTLYFYIFVSGQPARPVKDLIRE